MVVPSVGGGNTQASESSRKHFSKLTIWKSTKSLPFPIISIRSTRRIFVHEQLRSGSGLFSGIVLVIIVRFAKKFFSFLLLFWLANKIEPKKSTSVFDKVDHNNVLKLLAFSYRLQTLKVIIRYDKYEMPDLEWLWNVIRFLFRQDKKFKIEITFDLIYDTKTRRCIEQALRTENITAVSLSVRDISKGDYWHGSNTFSSLIFSYQ